MSDKKRDKKGRILRPGERQREDGRYEYRYKDAQGNTRSIYSWKLVETDKLPAGKEWEASLREMEKKIQRDLEDGINGYAGARTTLNSFFEAYMETDAPLPQSLGHILLVHVLVVGSGGLLQLILGFHVGIKEAVQRGSGTGITVDTIFQLSLDLLLHFPKGSFPLLSCRELIRFHQLPTVNAAGISLGILVPILVSAILTLTFARTEYPTLFISFLL